MKYLFDNIDIIFKIKRLRIGECLILDINEDLCNVFQLNEIHIKSYENLYNSYVNKTCEQVNNFNIELLLEKYIELQVKKDYIIEEIIKRAISEEAYNIINSSYRYNYFIDYSSNYIILSIKGDKK